jgi:hypothetical protein
VNKIPDDYGARIVFMAMYAKDFLGQNAEDLKSALSGKPPESQGGGTEQFASICPPDVAASRREEALRKSKESCVLPETLSAEEIQEAITERLKVIVSTKTKSLQAKGINPTIDIIPIIKEAEKSAVYLNQKKMETEQGTLAPTAPAPGL